MRATQQISSFWELAREQSVEGEVRRRRIAVVGAITLGFCGLLIAVGLAVVVLVALAAIVVSVGLASLLTVLPKVRTLGGDGIGYVGDRSRATRGQLVPLWRRLQSAASTVLAETRARGSRVARAVGHVAQEATMRFAPRVAQVDLKREAIRLNATGTQQRRDGRYDAAVECHREALEILRCVGDRHAVALTQSNLALALSHAGDDAWAVGLLEEAAETLRDLGDEEHEAQIMANLGVTHRRHGRPEEGDNVLELALSKLSPASSAYQAIEAVRRAG